MLKSVEYARKKKPKHSNIEEMELSAVRAAKPYSNLDYRDVNFGNWWLVAKGYENGDVWTYYSPSKYPQCWRSLSSNIIIWKRDTRRLIGDIKDVLLVSNIPLSFAKKSKILPNIIALTKGEVLIVSLLKLY